MIKLTNYDKYGKRDNKNLIYFPYVINVTRWVKMDEIEEADDENGIL